MTEPRFHDRPSQRPALVSRKIAGVQPQGLAIRFVAGGLTSAVAGLVTIAFGARVGGILLAFPAILAASLTLVEEQEDSKEAREDARGAVVGGAALTAFAATAALLFVGSIAGALVLVIATVIWVAAALLGYVALWWR